MESSSNNPNLESPWHKFPILHPELLKSLPTQGFRAPTEIQSQTLTEYPNYNDFIIASMTVFSSIILYLSNKMLIFSKGFRKNLSFWTSNSFRSFKRKRNQKIY